MTDIINPDFNKLKPIIGEQQTQTIEDIFTIAEKGGENTRRCIAERIKLYLVSFLNGKKVINTEYPNGDGNRGVLTSENIAFYQANIRTIISEVLALDTETSDDTGKIRDRLKTELIVN